MNASSANRQVMLVTGGSSGIGKACCDRLSIDHIVYGASRSNAASGEWTYLRMDITDPASVNEAVASIMSDHGRIDAVVHCAGSSIIGSVEETTPTEALSQFGTNYFGTVHVLQAVLPIMRRQGGGRIVIVGSIAGLIGLPFQAHYSATKSALDGMIEALRHEVRPFNIHVSLLHPGNFRTSLNDNRVRAKIRPDSPYRSAFERAATFYADEEINASSPTPVAVKVEKILNQRRPKVRYLIGSPLEQLGVLAKRLLPSAIFELVTRIFYFP